MGDTKHYKSPQNTTKHYKTPQNTPQTTTKHQKPPQNTPQTTTKHHKPPQITIGYHKTHKDNLNNHLYPSFGQEEHIQQYLKISISADSRRAIRF